MTDERPAERTAAPPAAPSDAPPDVPATAPAAAAPGPATTVSLPGLAPAAPPGRSAAEAALDDERRAAVLDALRFVVDPELGLDVVAMGLVYDVRVVGAAVEVDMTLTTPGCPVSESLPLEAAEAVRAALPEAEVDVRLVWEPPWTPERLSPEGLAALGFGP